MKMKDDRTPFETIWEFDPKLDCPLPFEGDKICTEISKEIN